MFKYIFMYMFKYVHDHVYLCCVSSTMDIDKKRMRTSIYCRHDMDMDTGNNNDTDPDTDTGADTGADIGTDIDDDKSTGIDSGAADTDTDMDMLIFADEATLSSVFDYIESVKRLFALNAV